MINFKLKELTAVLCILALTACGDLNDEFEGNDSNDTPVTDTPVDGGSEQPIVVDPVVDPGDSPFADSQFAFQIIDEDEEFVTDLEDGDVIDLSSLPELFHIEAVSTDVFNSVSVQASGPGFNIDRIEESPVWTVNATGDGFDGGAGTFSLSATGYSLDGAAGDASGMSSISVTFNGGEPTTTPPPTDNGGPLPVTDVVVQWEKPTLYTNGETLGEDNIAGYEILYRGAGELSFQRFYVEGAANLDTEITLTGTGDFEFSIASVDIDGLYSIFTDPVTITL